MKIGLKPVFIEIYGLFRKPYLTTVVAINSLLAVVS
jgi:hypothetical protein